MDKGLDMSRGFLPLFEERKAQIEAEKEDARLAESIRKTDEYIQKFLAEHPEI